MEQKVGAAILQVPIKLNKDILLSFHSRILERIL